MKKALFCIVLVLSLKPCVKAQFGSPEEKKLQTDAMALAKAGKTSQAMAMVQTIKDNSTRLSGINGIIESLYEKGKQKEGRALAQQQLDSVELQVTTGKERGYAYSNMSYPYAILLMKHKLANEAYPVLKKTVAYGGVQKYTVRELYAKSMVNSGRYEEAVEQLEWMIVHGMATPYAQDTLYKEAYIGWKGKKADFAMQKDVVVKRWKAAVRDSVSKHGLEQAAPDFILKDGDGKEVSLASLIGKTVVLDFWATWCTPCKASFPVMKQAQDHFKGDTAVVFLFIHTMERGTESPVPEAMSYLRTNQFDFRTLFDLRDPATKISAVSKSFDVRGIPMKFVIDRNGMIRFTSIGGGNLAHTDAMSVEHIVAMVELAAGRS